MIPKEIFSIGHSTLNLDDFLALLKEYNIEAIADVRSSPYSQRQPHFNREDLKRSLKEIGINYVFLGKELGARSDDPNCYEGKKAIYEKISETELFKSGMDRLKEGTKKLNVCMMCAEKEPLDCHRSILVGRYLNRKEFILKHIKVDGSIELHEDTMNRLIGSESLQEDMFSSKEEKLNSAYEKRGKEIAFIRKIE